MQLTGSKQRESVTRPPFSYLVIIEPLGLLYGSAGKFLSPENLVGRAGTSFPPSTATLSGIFAASLFKQEVESEALKQLQLAGPFWAFNKDVHNFYVPTPMNCLVKNKQVKYQLVWHNPPKSSWRLSNGDLAPNDKYKSGTWINIKDWELLKNGKNPKVEDANGAAWRSIPHLHPKLKQDERRVDEDGTGSLFLENGIQLNPDACLVYLSNTSIAEGWYRFGGEGHMANVRCEPIQESLKAWLDAPLGQCFALITPAVWGSNRLSYRAPHQDGNHQLIWGDYSISAILTERPRPFRYRLGGDGNVKRLSRGRYAVPAGTVYVLERSLQDKDKTWQKWSDDWFPREGYSFKRWGCGLALPLT